MPSLKFLLLLLITFLIKNETFLELTISLLAIAHVLLNTAYHLLIQWLAGAYPHLPELIIDYYAQVLRDTRPAMLKGAVKLTNGTAWLVRNAPCGWCTLGMRVMGGAETVAKWLAGEAARVGDEWAAIWEGVVAYCAKAGECVV